MDEKSKKISVLSILSIIFGVIGLLSACLFIGIIPAVVGLVLGIVAVVKKDKIAIIGIICSAIGLIIGGCMFAMMLSDISKENEVRELIESGKYETALEKIDDYGFSDEVEEEFYYDIYIGQERYDEAFTLIYTSIEESYGGIDTVSEDKVEKMRNIYESLSNENQKKMDQFEKERKELIQAKEELALQEKLEQENQNDKTEDVVGEENSVVEEDKEEDVAEPESTETIIQRFGIDENEALKDEYITDKLTVIEQYTGYSHISDLREYLFDSGYLDDGNQYTDLEIIEEFILCYRGDSLANYLEYAYEDLYVEESIEYEYVEYKQMMRYEQEYVGQYVSMLVYVVGPIGNDERMQLASPAQATELDGQIYYNCSSYDNIVICDKRDTLDVWLGEDIIEIYAKYLGKEEYVNHKYDTITELPTFEVYESILLRE